MYYSFGGRRKTTSSVGMSKTMFGPWNERLEMINQTAGSVLRSGWDETLKINFGRVAEDKRVYFRIIQRSSVKYFDSPLFSKCFVDDPPLFSCAGTELPNE